MLYKNIAQTKPGVLSDRVSDNGSDGSSFHARSIANSVASNMTGKLDEQFSELQKLLSGLTTGTMSKLVLDLQELASLAEDDNLTAKELKRALVPFSNSIKAVQDGVGAIERDLLALRASNDEISDALLTFEGYIINHAVFFKKIDLILSGTDVYDAEDQGDDFAAEIRARNETEQASIQAYTEGLNSVCLEVQDTIARRLGLEPLSSDYIGDPSALRLTGDLLSALSSNAVVRDKSVHDGSSAGSYKYRDEYNVLRGEAHVALSESLDVLTASLAFPYGKNFVALKKQLGTIIQEQENKFEQFLTRMESESVNGQEDPLRQEALSNIARDLAEEVGMYQAVKAALKNVKLYSSATSSAEALKPIVSQLSSFLMSPKDVNISFSLARMTQQVDDLLELYGVSVPDLPVRLSDLHDHLVLGIGLKESKGDKLDKKTLVKVRDLLVTLRDREDISHYAAIDAIRTQFETNFAGVTAKKK